MTRLEKKLSNSIAALMSTVILVRFDIFWAFMMLLMDPLEVFSSAFGLFGFSWIVLLVLVALANKLNITVRRFVWIYSAVIHGVMTAAPLYLLTYTSWELFFKGWILWIIPFAVMILSLVALLSSWFGISDEIEATA